MDTIFEGPLFCLLQSLPTLLAIFPDSTVIFVSCLLTVLFPDYSVWILFLDVLPWIREALSPSPLHIPLFTLSSPYGYITVLGYINIQCLHYLGCVNSVHG